MQFSDPDMWYKDTERVQSDYIERMVIYICQLLILYIFNPNLSIAIKN